MKNKKTLKEELLAKRVFFRKKNIRNEFFAKLKTLFSSWTMLGQHFDIYKSRLERFRNGTISLPYEIFMNFLSQLENADIIYFHENIILKDRYWGRSKGGISTYKNHKDIFEKGRKIGVQKPRCSKYHFQLDMPLTPNLCELIGAFIGDGFTNRYGNAYVVQYTGDPTLDEEYLIKTIKPIIKEISQNSNPIITKKDSAVRLTINSKEFHNLLTKRFKFTSGKKAYTVTIPEEIIKSKDYNMINRCIRGIFDTDGCIFLDKRSTYKLPYLRIAINMKSKNLIEQVHSLLLNQGISATITKNSDRVQINGFENCKKFIEKIGFSNKRHLDKIKF